MEIIALGVGDAFSARHYGSCLAIGAEGEWLLIDCPHPIRKMLAESPAAQARGLDVPSFRAVVLTHLHADHCSGLEGFGYFSWFVARKRATIACTRAVGERLWGGHLAAGMEALLKVGATEPEAKELEDWFEPLWMPEDEPTRIGPFLIETRRTIHHIPTTALRITAGGRTLGYSADTAFDPSLIEWLSAADLVIHETNFGIHTPYEKLAALPAELRQKMRLIHYWDQFDTASSVIPALRQGELVAW